MKTEKYLIFSDLHGMTERARELFRRHADADGIFFLGDGLGDLPDAPVPIVSVRGNCDFFGKEPKECLLDLGGKKILLMHGDSHAVKSGLDRALRYASERGADALLFGHTHLPIENYYPEETELAGGYLLPRPIIAFNPGSLGYPPDGRPSYGLLQLRGGQMLFSHGTL